MSLTANITHECIDDETITTVELCYNTDVCGWKFTPENVSHKQWSGLAAACRGGEGATYAVDNSEGNCARITVGCGTVYLALCATGNGEGGTMTINLGPEQCVDAFEAAAAATAE